MHYGPPMIRTTTFALVSLLALGGCAPKRSDTPPAASTTVTSARGDDTIETKNVTTVTAIVVAIDHAKRLVTLRGPEGNEATIKVGDEVKNLAQVRKGDEVTAAYYESIAVTLKKPGEAVPGVVASDEIETAPLGEKPGAAEAATVTIVATVKKVDRARQTLTLQSAEGEQTTVKVQDPANLEKVKAGDLLEITHTEAVAISVDKP